MIKKNTLLKSIIYRLYSTIITMIVAYWLTKNLTISLSIGIIDTLIKIFSYYFFDEIWNYFFGIKNKPAVIWLTGLSGAGKTTIAHDLMMKFQKKNIFPVLLDGDEIRNAIRQFGFDEESRKRHNLNVGFIASLFEKQGNIVIVSLISPYEDVRNEIRGFCKNFIEIYISTNIEICQQRDPKGLYKRALNGEIKEFTGISAPYFAPESPEITIDTSDKTVEECSKTILNYYQKHT